MSREQKRNLAVHSCRGHFSNAKALENINSEMARMNFRIGY